MAFYKYPSSVTTNGLPVGASTSAKQDTGNSSLSSIDTKTPALGQALAASSVPVVLTAAQIASLAPLGTVAVTQATGTNLHAVVDSSALPTGASTSALQSTGNASIASVDTKTPALGQALASSSVPVVLTAAQVSTLTPLSTVSISNLPAVYTDNITQIGGTAISLGQKVAASSLPVSIASDQSALPATQSGTWTTRQADGTGNLVTSEAVLSQRGMDVVQLGRTTNFIYRNVYSTTTITTGAYVQIAAITSGLIKEIEIFDSSGQTMKLAVGSAGLEIDQCYIFPGGNGRIPLTIPAGSRISLMAVSANATSGEIDINFYS